MEYCPAIKTRAGAAATSAGSLAFFAGGFDFPYIFSFGTNAVDQVDIYNANATTNPWTTAKLSQARAGLAAASAGNKVLFAGGLLNPSPFFGSTGPVSTMDVYDIPTNQWSVIQLPQIKSFLTATNVGNKILFAERGAANPRIDVYDAVTEQWSYMTILISVETATSIGTKAFFAGGDSNQIYIYDVITGIWTPSVSPQAQIL